MIHAARLDQRVTKQARTTVQKATGVEEVWTDVDTRWAAVAPLSSRVRAEYAQRDSVVTHRIVMRSPVEMSLGEHRWSWRGRILVPAEPPEPMPNRQGFVAIPVRLAPEEPIGPVEEP